MTGTAQQARPLPGTAQYVIAHAATRALVGRPPIMPYLAETDPVKALKLAREVAASQSLSSKIQTVAAKVLSRKPYTEMTEAELRMAVREIVKTSRSKAQVERRLREELGCPYEIRLSIQKPSQDRVGNEAREILSMLGGIIMAHGAVASGRLIINGRRVNL